MELFKKKTGLEVMKELFEKANEHMVKSVEELGHAQSCHNEIYKLILKTKELEEVRNEQND